MDGSLTVEIKLRFKISPASCARDLNYSIMVETSELNRK